jgi:Glycosyltransferase family 87
MLTRRIGSGPLIMLVAAAFVVADVTLIWIGSQADFGFDFVCCYQQAAERAINDPATLYDWSDTYTFRYTPIGALPFVPFVPLDEATATWAFLAVKLAVLGVIAAWFSSRWTGAQRIGVALLVITFPPIVHDLMIGNVSTFTLLAFLAVARWQDPRGGVAIGLLTVLMPKPHLVPVLVYLALRRPRDFLASVVTMGAGVVIGLFIFGLEPWVEFLGTLREPLERTFTANVGWSALLGPAGVIVGLLIGLVVFVFGVRLGGARGYGLSIIAGILAGPYTFIHYLSGTLVAVEPVLRTRPRWLVPFPWLLIVFPLIPVWLTGLAGVVWRSPEPDPPATQPPSADIAETL